jgi:RND family efflux transporter MFP subunit
MRTTSSFALLLGVLAGGAVTAGLGVSAGDPPADAPRPPTGGVSPGITAGDILQVKGRTRPAPGRRAIIAPVVLHPVIEVRVKPGDRVKKEQVLVLLDADEPQADLRAKKAMAESAKVATREAHRYLGAAEKAFATGSMSEAVYFAARTAAARAAHDERAAVAAVDSSQAELEHYTVQAPMDGVVTWLDVAPGMVSRPGTTVWGEILDLREIDVQCELAPEQADRVEVGQAAEVRLPWRPVARWTSEVVFVGPAADETTGQVPVRVRVKNAGERLRCFIAVTVRFGAGVAVGGKDGR